MTFKEFLREFNYPSNTKVSGEPSPEVSDPDGAIPLGDFNGSVGGEDTSRNLAAGRYEIRSGSDIRYTNDETEAGEIVNSFHAQNPYAKVRVVDKATGKQVYPQE